ncbi:MAG TPA: cyclase family protein [Pyrinomonadaceae bacterium]|jgi:kynurenine formamidase|nr:cyclase family protein [Pyrinomonadaceae bacterium]
MRYCALFLISILFVSALYAKPSRRIVDLTYPFDSDSVYWPTAETFKLETDFEGVTDKGYFYSAYRFSAAEHGGTHLDAPVHFAKGRNSVDQIPLEQLTGPGLVVDVTAQCTKDPDYLISTADIQNWERRNGRIGAGSIVLLRTGFGRYYPDRKKYLGTDERGAAAVAKLHFPGLDPAAARWLTTNRSIKAIGLDTASIDRGQSTLFESHRALFEKNVPAFENVANLDQLPVKGFTVIALPMKIKGGSGGPLRIIAML